MKMKKRTLLLFGLFSLLFSQTFSYAGSSELGEIKKIFIKDGFGKTKSSFDLEYKGDGICRVMFLGSSPSSTSILIFERIYSFLPLEGNSLYQILNSSKCITPLMKICAPFHYYAFRHDNETPNFPFVESVSDALEGKKEKVKFGDCKISVIKRDRFIQFNVEINKKDAIKNLKELKELLKGK